MNKIIDTSDVLIKSCSSRHSIDELLKKLRQLNGKSVVIQIFDPEFIINRMHILGAYANAGIAFKNGSNKTGSIAMEMLLFAAFTNQIGTAIERAGAKKSADFVLFSNDKGAFRKFMEMLSSKDLDFKTNKAHVLVAAKTSGISYDGLAEKDLDASILEKIAFSRLQSD